jgi:hypothetical protein
MIKYKLKCRSCKNVFDSWFSSSREYAKLKKQKYLSCNICNSASIEKTLMSPSVIGTKNPSTQEKKDEKYISVKKQISNYQKFIKDNFEFVGNNFAYEARSIHYQNKKSSKGIYGSASKEEIKELKDEGIDTEIIPWIENNIN